jgi:hypothetical protein
MILNDMLKVIKNRKVFFNFLKLLWAVIILYLWLKLSVFYTWEKTDLLEDKLYETISTGGQIFDEEWLDFVWKHDAPSQDSSVISQLLERNSQEDMYRVRLDSICKSNKIFCDKIKFQGDFTNKDKYIYMASSIYVLRHIERNIKFGRDITKQLNRIVINDDVWSRRWFANWDSVTINLGSVSSYVEFLELLVHELWHVVDLWIVRWYSSQKSDIYTEFGRSVLEIDDPSIEFYKLSFQSEKVRDSQSVKEDFCSWYGMTNPFEDFAECHNLYLNHNAIFRLWAQENEIMKKKYNFMANLYGGVYMFDSSKDLEKAKNNKLWRPWDTTKM